MDKKDDKNQPKKVFDVKRPGKTPAAATSRPVITMHKPPIKDQDVSLGFGTERRGLMDPKQKIRVKPAASAPEPGQEEPESPAQAPSAPPLPQQPQEETKTEVPKEADSEPKTQQKPPQQDGMVAPTPEKPQEETQPQPPATEPAAAAEAEAAGKAAVGSSMDAPVQQSQPRSQNQNPPAKSEPLHMGMPGTLKRGKIVVSHHGKGRIIWLEILAVLAILLLLAAIANFLLDAEIIKTDFNIPQTNYFDNS